MAARQSVERKIYFYRIDNGLHNGEPIPFQAQVVLSAIDALPWTNLGRYWITQEDNAIACWPDRLQAHVRARIGSIRRDALPEVENGGVLTPLAIPDRAGIADYIHMVFFPNNIVGSEYNYYGPRATKAAYYLAEKARDIVPPFLNFQPLLRNDALRQLRTFEDIRKLRIAISPALADTMRELNRSLSRGLDALSEVGRPEIVELVLRGAPNSRRPLDPDLLDLARSLLRNNRIRQEAVHLEITGRRRQTGGIETLDLLSDKLVSKRQIIRSRRQRTLESASAYAAIEDAYEELRDEIEAAAALVELE